MAVIKCKNLPFTVSWDAAIFTDICEWMRIVDWAPGGWFDACCCNGSSIVSFMHEISSYSFDNTDYVIRTPQDTFFTLFFPFAGDESVGTMDAISSKNLISVFPNPATDHLFIEGLHPQETAKAVIHFFDMNGQEILSVPIMAGSVNISILENGVFLYKIVNERVVINTGKVIVDKK